MIKNIVALVMAGSAIASTGVAAADLAPRTYLPPEPILQRAAEYRFTGVYLGVNGGVANLAAGGSGHGFAQAQKTIGTVGGQLGYSYQFGMLVAGVEASYQPAIAGMQDSLHAGAGIKLRNTYGYGALRGRVGFAIDQFLIYGIGGLALTDVELSGTINTRLLGLTSGRLAGQTIDLKSRTTLTGWTLGGGLEFALSPNWRARIEAVHIRFDGKKLPIQGLSNSASQVTGTLLTLGLNYQF